SLIYDLIERINHTLGNIGATVVQRRPAVERPSANRTLLLRRLAEEMTSGTVDLLLILGGNPAYNAPVDFDFANALAKVRMSVHHTLHPNETSRLCHWLIPAAHFLESWSDARAFDGSISIVQPLVQPLYANVSIHEMIGGLIERPVRSAYEIVRETWQLQNPTPHFEIDWRRALSDGVFHDADLASESTFSILSPTSSPPNEGGLEILFRPDPNILDGRYAN